MPPMGPDERKRPQGQQSAAEQDAAAREPDDAPAPQRGPGDLPPGVREEPSPETTRRPDAADEPTIAEEVGETADPDAVPSVHRDRPAPDEPRTAGDGSPPPWDRDVYPPGYGPPAQSASWGRADPGQSSPQSAQRYDRFGWPIPAGGDEGPAAPPDRPPRDAQPPAQGGNRSDTSSWRISPASGAPYSGQFPAQTPNSDVSPRGPYSGQFPAQIPAREPAPDQPPRGPYSGQGSRSGALPIPPPADAQRSGQFPVAPRDPATQSGVYAAPASGPIPSSPYISGPLPRVGPQAGAERRSGPLAYPSEVTSTGSRRVIVAPDAGVGSLLADRSALAFLLAAVMLVGAMIAYIVLRYAHFPNQIALHFGAAGPSEPNRIGEKRELWTIPFIVGIVLAANTALAWAVYRYDRFAARLLALGCALVGAVAWVVLLTLLHR